MIHGILTKEQCYNPEQERITRSLVEVIKRFADRKDTILEIGPSFGRNLDTLKEDGFKHLAGLEPDKASYEGLKHKKYFGTLDDLVGLPDYDVIFTKSVIYLIEEPDYQLLCDKTKKYLILCEGEIHQHEIREWLHNRNYKEIFEGLGMKQIFETDGFVGNLLIQKGNKFVDSGINGTKIRVFKK
jgi:hypothetical protein